MQREGLKKSAYENPYFLFLENTYEQTYILKRK